MPIRHLSTRTKSFGSLALLAMACASYFIMSPIPDYKPTLSERARRFGVLDERRREINRMDLSDVLMTSPEVFEGMKNELLEFNSMKEDAVLQSELKANYEASKNNKTKSRDYRSYFILCSLLGIYLGGGALSEMRRRSAHADLSD